MGKNMIILGADFSVNGIDGHALFDNSTWFNGYWAASGTSATMTSGNTYLTCYFIALPEAGESWTLTPKGIDGYLVGMRPYVCRTLDGTTPQTFTRSDNTYGDVSGASSRTLFYRHHQGTGLQCCILRCLPVCQPGIRQWRWNVADEQGVD